MRCLLPRHLLAHGFFPTETSQNDRKNKITNLSNYSWSGQRRAPSYLSNLIFPDEFLTTLRTISMNEEQLYQVSAMLQEVCHCSKVQSYYIYMYSCISFLLL